MHGGGIFLELAVIVMVLAELVSGTIMCSICRSNEEPRCEMGPPPPRPCPQLGSDGVESCSTVRIFNKKTGQLTQFLRSCSDSMKQGCFDSRPGYKTCADICFTDGCNGAVTLFTQAHYFTCICVGLLLSALLVVFKTGAG